MTTASMGTPPADIDIGSLREGDILLMMGVGPLSDLIAWASDGRYSHAAIMADGGDLIEASLGGVRRIPLAARLVEYAHYHFIDAYRVRSADGGDVAAGDRALVRGHAEDLLGIPYPVDQLALLGVIMAVRGKWPRHPLARRLVRIALDRALPADSGAMVCSEVVYRAWAECATVPAGRLAPAIVPGERGMAPFPDIDWMALLEEFNSLPRPGDGGGAGLRAAPGLAVANALQADVEVSDGELEAARARVLAGLQGGGLRASAGVSGARQAPPAEAWINPRLVSPQDLANSPCVAALGRLMAAPVDAPTGA